MPFKDKVVFITGASSGIGAELAMQFAAMQAKLILTARNIVALEFIQQQCLQKTEHCKIIPANLLEINAIESLTQQAKQQFGKIDIVILNAGVTQRSITTKTNIDVFRKLMEINYFVPITMAKTLLPFFTKQLQSHIVVISSVAGLMGYPLRGGYAASKHALKAFFETLQSEHTIKGLSITIVSPGRIDTPISLSALTENGTAYNVRDRGQLNGIPVDICVKKIINAIEKKRKHVIIAKQEKLLLYIKWYLPFLYYYIARKKGLES